MERRMIFQGRRIRGDFSMFSFAVLFSHFRVRDSYNFSNLKTCIFKIASRQYIKIYMGNIFTHLFPHSLPPVSSLIVKISHCKYEWPTNTPIPLTKKLRKRKNKTQNWLLFITLETAKKTKQNKSKKIHFELHYQIWLKYGRNWRSFWLVFSKAHIQMWENAEEREVSRQPKRAYSPTHSHSW